MDRKFIKSSAKVKPDPAYYIAKARAAEKKGNAAKAEWARSRIVSACRLRDGLDYLDTVALTEEVDGWPAGTRGHVRSWAPCPGTETHLLYTIALYVPEKANVTCLAVRFRKET